MDQGGSLLMWLSAYIWLLDLPPIEDRWYEVVNYKTGEKYSVLATLRDPGLVFDVFT